MIKDVAQEAEKAKTFTPGAPASEERKLTDEHRAIYADRIAKATTVEEVRAYGSIFAPPYIASTFTPYNILPARILGKI